MFGAAKPVDTAAREREIEEKIKREEQLFAEMAEKRTSESGSVGNRKDSRGRQGSRGDSQDRDGRGSGQHRDMQGSRGDSQDSGSGPCRDRKGSRGDSQDRDGRGNSGDRDRSGRGGTGDKSGMFRLQHAVVSGNVVCHV